MGLQVIDIVTKNIEFHFLMMILDTLQQVGKTICNRSEIVIDVQ